MTHFFQSFHYSHYNLQTQSGQSLVELLLAIGLLAIVIPAIGATFVASRQGKPQQQERVQAVMALEETQEAVRNIRESGWTNIATDGTYHPTILGSSWTLASGAETLDSSTGLSRQIVIADVYRDNSGKITASPTGNTLDPSTKQVTVTVSWTKPYASSLSSTTYLTRYLDNISWIQTTVADFSAGTLQGTTVTNNSGGEVVLAAGNANWCRPQDYVVNQINLPKLSNAIYAQEGHAWLGAGDGNASDPQFINVAISTPAPPATPSASIEGIFNGPATVNSIYSDGSYVYLATNDTSNQVKILNISSIPYTQVGTVNISSGMPANGVYVAGTVLYVTSGNYLYTYDVTTKTGSHNIPLGSVGMWLGTSSMTAKQVMVVNNYAFVGVSDTLFGMQRFKVSNGGKSFKLVGVSNLTWNQSPQGLYVNSSGTRAYVAYNQGSGFFPKGFFIVDTSTSDPPAWWPFPNWYRIAGSTGTGSMDPRGMVVVSGNRAIVVGTGGSEQYQVFDISNESNISECGGMAVTGGVFGISSILDSYQDAYSYITTGDTSNQFKIIQGGNGGLYATQGTFTSSPLSPGYQTSVNYFTATVATQSATTIKMQVAGTNPPGGNCTTATYIFSGPDGTTSTYFLPNSASISGTVPFGTYTNGYENPAQCFEYKAFFSTTDPNQTPVLYDTTFNHSP